LISQIRRRSADKDKDGDLSKNLSFSISLGILWIRHCTQYETRAYVMLKICKSVSLSKSECSNYNEIYLNFQIYVFESKMYNVRDTLYLCNNIHTFILVYTNLNGTLHSRDILVNVLRTYPLNVDWNVPWRSVLGKKHWFLYVFI